MRTFPENYYALVYPCLSCNVVWSSTYITNLNGISIFYLQNSCCEINSQLLTILFQVPKVWNSLPKNVKGKVNLAEIILSGYNISFRLILSPRPCPARPGLCLSPLVNCTSLIALVSLEQTTHELQPVFAWLGSDEK